MIAFKNSKKTEDNLWQITSAVIKVNSPKRSFWLTKIPYLGYVITGEGINPYPGKLQ